MTGTKKMLPTAPAVQETSSLLAETTVEEEPTPEIASPLVDTPDKHTSQTQADGYRLPDTELQQTISGGLKKMSAHPDGRGGGEAEASSGSAAAAEKSSGKPHGPAGARPASCSSHRPARRSNATAAGSAIKLPTAPSTPAASAAPASTGPSARSSSRKSQMASALEARQEDSRAMREEMRQQREALEKSRTVREKRLADESLKREKSRAAQDVVELTVKSQDSHLSAPPKAAAAAEKTLREMKGVPIFEVSGAGSLHVNGQYAWDGTETSGRLAFRMIGAGDASPTIHFKPEDVDHGAGWSISINQSRMLYLIDVLPVKRKTLLTCSMPAYYKGYSVSQPPAPSIAIIPGCPDNFFQLQDLYAVERFASGEHVSLTPKAWLLVADKLKLVSESAGNSVGQRNLCIEIARFCTMGAPEDACEKMHTVAKAACQGMIDQQPDQHTYAKDNGFVRPLNLPMIPDAKADKTVKVTQLDHIPYLTKANLDKYGVKVLCLAMQLQSSFIDWQLRKEFPKLGSILTDPSAKPKKYEQLGSLSAAPKKLLNRMIAKAPDYGGNPGGILDTVRRMLVTQNLEQQECFLADLLALNNGKSFKASKDASTGICHGRLKSTMSDKDAPVKQTIVNVLFTPNKYKKFTGEIKTPFTYKEMLEKCTEQAKQLSGSGYSKLGKSILRAPASRGNIQLEVDNGAAVFDVGNTISISSSTEEREELYTIKTIQHKTIILESPLTRNHETGSKIARVDHDATPSGESLKINHDIFRKGWDASGAAKTEFGAGGFARRVNGKEPMGIDRYTPTEEQQAIELIKSCESEEVRMVIEVQLYIDYFKRHRDQCHLWYDVARTANFTKLQDQFSSTREMDVVKSMRKPGNVNINSPRSPSGLKEYYGKEY